MRKTTALLLACLLILSSFSGCAGQKEKTGLGNGWEPEGEVKLEYAKEFSIEKYQDGFRLIKLSDNTRYLIVPEGREAPSGIDSDIVVLKRPVENIYLAATAAMCLFDAIGSLDAIKFSALKADGWYIEGAKKAMEEGKILYAGKYSEPDYELLMQYKCPLAVESLMIGHASGVKDKLEELGIPVFTDQASLETHPLGRTEWIKVYGAMLGKEDLADKLFDEQVQYLKEVENKNKSGATVAFFYINSAGNVVVRKSGDYITKMIELAGGKYIFSDVGDTKTRTSTVQMEMEKFYETAKDADYIIYNSTIGGEVKSLSQLEKKSSLLSEFRAVQDGHVWCTTQNMYQETMDLGEMIKSFQEIFSGEADHLNEVPFLYRLN